RRMIEIEEINAGVDEGQLAIRLKECSVARDCLVQKVGRLQQISLSSAAAKRVQKEIFCVAVEIKRSHVFRRRLFDLALFIWRELRLQLVGDRFRDLTLNSKDVGKIAIVSLRPKMGIVAGVDELRVHSHPTAGTLNTSFYHMGDAEFVCDLTEVTLTNDLILHHRSTADYFQVRDPRQIRQNLILHAVRKKYI